MLHILTFPKGKPRKMGDGVMADVQTDSGNTPVKPVDDITARRAVAGTDVEFIEAGGPPEAADAVAIALRRFLEGDEDTARAVLGSKFKNGTVDEILDGFRRELDAAAEADVDPADQAANSSSQKAA